MAVVPRLSSSIRLRRTVAAQEPVESADGGHIAPSKHVWSRSTSKEQASVSQQDKDIDDYEEEGLAEDQLDEPELDEDEEYDDDLDDEEEEVAVEDESEDSSSLEEILSQRSARAVVDEEDDDEPDIVGFGVDEDAPVSASLPTKVVPIKARQEFVCTRCHLVKARVQLADPERTLCRDCV